MRNSIMPIMEWIMIQKALIIIKKFDGFVLKSQSFDTYGLITHQYSWTSKFLKF